MTWFPAVLLLAGAACLVAGAWMLTPAAGVILAGVLLCGTGVAVIEKAPASKPGTRP